MSRAQGLRNAGQSRRLKLPQKGFSDRVSLFRCNIRRVSTQMSAKFWLLPAIEVLENGSYLRYYVKS